MAVSTERLLATWDPEDRFAQLETLVEIVRDLEALGAADAIVSLEGAARAAVGEAWLPVGDRRASDAGGL